MYFFFLIYLNDCLYIYFLKFYNDFEEIVDEF